MNHSIRRIALAILGLAFLGPHCFGQTYIQDYVRDAASVYTPADPFARGQIFKAQIGHGGRYYNCDNEECKRNSPWIRWTARPCQESVHNMRWVKKEFKQSAADALCRWKRGACQTCPTPTNYPPGAGYGALQTDGSEETNVAPAERSPMKSKVDSVDRLYLQPTPEPLQQSQLEYSDYNHTPVDVISSRPAVVGGRNLSSWAKLKLRSTQNVSSIASKPFQKAKQRIKNRPVPVKRQARLPRAAQRRISTVR